MALCSENFAALPWVRRTKKTMPELHNGVLVRMMAAGPIYDVACYIGIDPSGAERWIMSNISLDPLAITHWAYIEEPEHE